MQPTMEDIARKSGVSKMTVSRVFAGRNGASAATREKILGVAKDLNYEFNSLAQNFALNRSGFIGVATPLKGLLGSHYIAEIFKGFQRVFDDSVYDFALFDTLSRSFNDGQKLAKLHRQRKVEGLLIVAPHSSDEFLGTLSDLHVPLVVVGESVKGNVCSISCKNQAGIALLCSHLFELGHRKIGFVGGPHDLTSAIRREKAYVEFCRSKKLKNPASFLQPGDYTMRSGRKAGLALLSSRHRPTAIIAANDLMAFGVIESARELNLRIPKDISIAGFDDLPTADERCPSLTTIRQPVAEMAEQGARLLLGFIREGSVVCGHTRLPVSLIVRESTAAPPVVLKTRAKRS